MIKYNPILNSQNHNSTKLYALKVEKPIVNRHSSCKIGMIKRYPKCMLHPFSSTAVLILTQFRPMQQANKVQINPTEIKKNDACTVRSVNQTNQI